MAVTELSNLYGIYHLILKPLQSCKTKFIQYPTVKLHTKPTKVNNSAVSKFFSDKFRIVHSSAIKPINVLYHIYIWTSVYLALFVFCFHGRIQMVV